MFKSWKTLCERLDWKRCIRSNFIYSMQGLLSLTPRLIVQRDDGSMKHRSFVVECHNEENAVVVLDAEQYGCDCSPELALRIKQLWSDSYVQRAYQQFGHLLHYENLDYNFSSNLCEQVNDESFLPSDTDVLMNSRRTTGIQRFMFGLGSNLGVMFWDTGGQRSERKVCVILIIHQYVVSRIYIYCYFMLIVSEMARNYS